VVASPYKSPLQEVLIVTTDALHCNGALLCTTACYAILCTP
jgi:hypothetical protein